MNIPNNKRRQESRKKIETAFIRALQTKELNEISVTDICKAAEINRTTFYANYIDIYDLADAIQKNLANEVINLYKEEWEQQKIEHNFLKLFYHIKENPVFYNTYFKLNTENNFNLIEYSVSEAHLYYDNKYIDYHIEFFANGLTAVIKKWLKGGCKESPEEINDIIISEYDGKRR